MYSNDAAADGSYTGQLALATLAADLGINASVLKMVLDDAFNILQQNTIGSPGLVLHMALARRGFQIDGHVLYGKMNEFRNVFAGAWDSL
ncbi:hypothetical protein ACEQ8H_008494 [Pleosporales sp. CAS-2024a]